MISPKNRKARKMAMDEKIIIAMKAAAAVKPLDWEKAQELGEQFGVSPRAITAAATRNKIAYARKGRVSKQGTPVVSKSDLVASIAEKLDLDKSTLDGLDKANKTALEAVVSALQELEEDDVESDEVSDEIDVESVE